MLLGARRNLFANAAAGRLLAFGSCFAVNIGRVLREKGCSVFTMVIAEDVNSPFNNDQLLRRIFCGEESNVSQELQAVSGLDFSSLKSEFQRASDIIFTLGNIFHLELDGTPTLYAGRRTALVEESIDETVRHIESIFGLLQAHTNARILASISPVPIFGYRGDGFASVEEADCVSKSQLRTALHAVLKSFPEIRYIPTFEIFRWLPAHQSFSTFGTDDGNARHIGQALLKKVLGSIAGS
ncbi:MAG: GSCFA domain-containing protein [Betaproteobacteria bacterium]|nr:GSCFA domain-containing protein [Betaproteobacteria bacterium]